MKKRIKKGLTLKGAKIITAVVTAIFIVLLAIYLIVDISKNGVGATIFLGMMGLACVSCITAICWTILEAIVLKPIVDMQDKNRTTHFLSKVVFTELSFIPNDDNDSGEYEMLLAIQRGNGCKFFAKLNEEDEIILIVKDKDNTEIYSCEISNYHYFNLRFKKKAD